MSSPPVLAETKLGSPAKRPRSVRWNEDNLAHNEATKSATMKIDEPETPWASPPRELFDDDAAAAAHAAASHAGDHADAFRLAAQLAAAEGGFVPGAWGAAQPRDEAAAADHMAVDAQGAPGEEQWEEPAASSEPAAEDVELRKRLFEARRKALQGSYAGAVRAREQDQAQQLDGAEEDGEASGEDANKRMREEPLPPL